MKEINVGDKIKVKVRRYNQEIMVSGKVKEIKRPFGRYEYLLTDTKTSDFWARTIEQE